MINYTACKRQKKSKPFFKKWCLLLVFLLIFSILFYWQYKTSIFLNNNWRINILLNTRPTIIFSLKNAETDKNLLFLFPQNSYVKVPFNYSNYKLDSVFKLSEIEKKPFLFQNTVEDLFGIKVNILLNNNHEIIPNEIDLKKIFTFKAIFYKSKGLNLYDKCRLFLTIFSMKTDQLTLYNLKDINHLIKEDKLPDGAVVNSFDKEVLDSFIDTKFEDETIRNEGLTLELLNATDKPIGQKFARFVTNLGGKIIVINNIVEQINSCQIYVAKVNAGKKIVKYLENEFDCQLFISLNPDTADVIIKLGDTWAKRWQEQ